MWLRVALITAAIVLVVGIVYFAVLSSIPGLRISSWFRNPFKNAEVGGKSFSLHQIGWAWDLVGSSNAVMQAQVAATGLPFLHFNPEEDHLHVQLFYA